MVARMTKPHICEEERLTADLGKYLCISDHIYLKHLPEKQLGIQYREKETYDLIQKIMHGERLVTVIGPHACGKSSIANLAMHYIAERKFFMDGMLWINAKNVTECFILLRKIQRVVFNSFKIKEHTIRLINENTSSKSVIIEILIGFFNNYLQM